MSVGTGGRTAVTRALFRIGALRFGKFRLASGKTSSYYLDLRLLPSDVEAYTLSIEAYLSIARKIGEKEFDVVAGVATAGVTISSPLAYLMKKPMVYVRSEEKGHGLQKRVEGAILPRSRVLLIDDLATTGGSLVSAVEALRGQGSVVKEAAVLVDRLEGGRAALSAVGVRLWSFVDVRELVSTLFQERKVTKGDMEAVLEQIGGMAR